MQIVKIFPNSKEKCHFSIRKHNNKYYVFEGDKVLRTELDNFASAETEISLIILARRQHGVKEVPVSYTEVGVVVNQISEDNMPEQRKCKQCQTEFTAFGKGGTQKIYCSEKCRTKFNNQLKVENLKLTDLNETGNLRERKCKGCKQMFQPKKSNAYNCSQKCSQKSYQQKKRKEKQKQLKREQIITDSQSQLKDPLKSGFPLIENIENESLKTPNPVEELFTMKTEDLNDFHELTDKQVKLQSRLKRLEALASDMVDYIVLWCDVNKSFNNYQDYNSMLHDLVKMNFVDLSKKEIASVMPELIEWYDSGYLSVHSIDSQKEVLTKAFKERLRELIINEQVIPTEEQFNKSYFLRLLISQLQFIQTHKLDPFNRQEPIVRDYVLEKETPVETNKLTDAINLIDEKIEVLMTNQILLSEQSKIVTEVLKTISERVSKITQKRRGLFG